MTCLRTLFDFYINASIHVALSVYALTRVTEIYFDIPYDENLNYFIFYGTITGYNFIKYRSYKSLSHELDKKITSYSDFLSHLLLFTLLLREFTLQRYLFILFLLL